MLREANIGIGIHGREGNAAARSSDFSIRRFKHLVRLIAVHGRYCMIRNAGYIFCYFQILYFLLSIRSYTLLFLQQYCHLLGAVLVRIQLWIFCAVVL